MRLTMIIAALIVLIAGSILIVGVTASRPYEATLMTVVHRSQQYVYGIVTNIWEFPLLLNQAVKVELLESESDSPLTWIEYDDRNRPWIYEMTQINHSNQLVISILSNKMYDYGRWTIEVKGDSNSCYVSIQESSKFSNWWYQFRGLVYGRDKGLKMKINSMSRYFK